MLRKLRHLFLAYRKSVRSKNKSFLTAYNRVGRIKKEASLYYNGMVHHCVMMSSYDHSFAFVVHRAKPFGGPLIDQIDRPRVINISESDECIIIRDGLVYELKKEIR